MQIYICDIIYILLFYFVSYMSATKAKINPEISNPETDSNLHRLWLEMDFLGKQLRTDTFDAPRKNKDNELDVINATEEQRILVKSK